MNHGGVPTFAKGIVDGFLSLEKVDVSLLMRSNLKPMEFNGINSILVSDRIAKKASKFLFLFLVMINQKKIYKRLKNREIKKIINSNYFDYIYTPTTYLNYSIDYIPTLVSLHDIQEKDNPENFNLFERIYRNFFVNLTLEGSKKIHVSSEFIKNTIVSHYGQAHRKIDFVVVGEGVDLKFFEPNKNKERIIVFPARAWKHKNHETFFSALGKLKNIDDFRFVITGSSLPDFEKIGIQVPGNVEIVGFLDLADLKSLYSKAFCVISCSRYESSSLPLLEGIASGCRIIASNIPAHLEMATKFHFNLFDTESSDDLAKVISAVVLDFGTTNSALFTSHNYEVLKSSDWTSIAGDLLESLDK
jgi:glycosyltransferase involved in cell wall biosynthesis